MINDISKKILNDFKRVLKSFKRYFENKFLHFFKIRDFILPKITLIIPKKNKKIKKAEGFAMKFVGCVGKSEAWHTLAYVSELFSNSRKLRAKLTHKG